MSAITEAEETVLNLPARERGRFAAKLLATLRPAGEDDEAIIAEALRRSEELTNTRNLRSHSTNLIAGCRKDSDGGDLSPKGR
jgi:hypothetical protein